MVQAERAFDQVVEWVEHFEPLEDPRQAGKVWYRLDEVLLLCLVAVLAAAESWVENRRVRQQRRPGAIPGDISDPGATVGSRRTADEVQALDAEESSAHHEEAPDSTVW